MTDHASTGQTSFEHAPLPDRKPPITQVGAVRWIRDSFFSSITNTALTLFAVWVLYLVLPPLFRWAFIDATFSGSDSSVCKISDGGELKDAPGACWTFIKVRFNQIMFGLWYTANPDQIWRPVTAFFGLIGLALPLFFERTPFKLWLGAFILFVYPFIVFALIHGEWLGLPVAQTDTWGGLMLTLILALVGIVFALPLGILLALGRRSKLPAVKALSVGYIEFWRGTPLITILFMASVMLPLFFPEGVNFDKVVRAMIGITLFQSAYTAEAIRGGLSAIAKGQFEAADALGLSYWKKTGLIILPQALRISIPGIVNTYISLFKDTSLVAIIGLLDLLEMGRTAARSPQWKGFDTEAFVFAAFIFWVFCYSMSRYSRYIEDKIDRATKH